MAVATGDLSMKDGPAADSCAAFLACASACTTQACVDTCSAKVTGGNNAQAKAAIAALGICQATKCLPDAGTECVMGSATSSCRTCVTTKCLAEVGMCMTH